MRDGVRRLEELNVRNYLLAHDNLSGGECHRLRGWGCRSP